MTTITANGIREAGFFHRVGNAVSDFFEAIAEGPTVMTICVT